MTTANSAWAFPAEWSPLAVLGGNLYGNLAGSQSRKLGKDRVTLSAQGEIFFRDSPLIMRRQGQGHFVKAYVNIGMMIQFLGFFGDLAHKCDGGREPVKEECSPNILPTLRLIREAFQLNTDFFGNERGHDIGPFLATADFLPALSSWKLPASLVPAYGVKPCRSARYAL